MLMCILGIWFLAQHICVCVLIHVCVCFICVLIDLFDLGDLTQLILAVLRFSQFLLTWMFIFWSLLILVLVYCFLKFFFLKSSNRAKKELQSFYQLVLNLGEPDLSSNPPFTQIDKILERVGFWSFFPQNSCVVLGISWELCKKDLMKKG